MEQVTHWLQQLEHGDPAALSAAYEALYEDLRRAAHHQLRQRRGTLCTTVLVNESWLKLQRAQGLGAESRAHFLNLAAQAMRQIVVDHARARMAGRRGGGVTVQELVEDIPEDPGLGIVDLLALDAALDRLAAIDGRLAKLVEMRYFGGYAEAEIAQACGITERTVQRDWRRARAWLLAALGEPQD